MLEGPIQIVDRLLELGADVNSMSTVDGNSPLHLATRRGKLDLVMLLLERGGDNIVHKKCSYGRHALQMACVWNYKDVAELLLNRGANVDEKDVYGSTALTLASEFASENIVSMLLDRGANINEKCYKVGMNSLHYASCNTKHKEGRLEVVRCLLDRGADIHEKSNKYGRSALHFASENGHVEVSKLLLYHGANVNDKEV